MEKTCPKCSKTGDIETLFGFRMCAGVKRAQSQCKSCRSGKNKTSSTPAACDHGEGIEREIWRLREDKNPEPCDECDTLTQGWCPACGGVLCDECECFHGGEEDEYGNAVNVPEETRKRIREEAAIETQKELGFVAKPQAKKQPRKTEPAPVYMRNALYALADALSLEVQRGAIYDAARNAKPIQLALELSSKWTVCSGCSAPWRADEPRFRFTLDPQAAGWNRGFEGWDCLQCQLDEFDHGSIDYNKKGAEIRLGPSEGNNLGKFVKSVTKKEAAALVKESKGRELAFWKEILKGIEERQTHSSYTCSSSVSDKDMPIVQKFLNYKKPAAPTDPLQV